jgi:hypothetical protein
VSEDTTNPQTAEEIAAAQAAATEAAAKAQAEADAAAAKAQAEADAAAAKETAKAKEGRPTKARLLQDCEHGKANDLVTLPEGEAKALEAAGVLDTHKAAVAYAASLEQNQK